MYVPYRNMPEKLRAREPFEGNSVTASILPNGGYRVMSFRTIMLETDSDGIPVYFDPSYYSVTTNKIQHQIDQVFRPITTMCINSVAVPVEGPITGPITARRWRHRLGVEIFEEYDEPNNIRLFAIAMQNGTLILMRGFHVANAKIYSCRSLKEARRLGEVLINASEV